MPPAIVPVSELLPEDVWLEVLEANGGTVRDPDTVDVAAREPVDLVLVAVDSGLSERSDECYMRQLIKWQLTANRLSKRYVEYITFLYIKTQHHASR